MPHSSELYFGAITGGFVRKASGGDDLGSDIVTVARGAFIVPSRDQNTNLYTAIRPENFKTQGDISGFVGVDTDYFDRSLTGTSVQLASETDTTPWGSDWGSPWGSKT